MKISRLFVPSLLTFSLAAGEVPVTPGDMARLIHLDRTINSPYTEYTPFITPDEKYLYFESDRPGGVGEKGDFDLWFAENSSPGEMNPKFRSPVNVGKPVNTDFFDGLPSLRLREDGSYEMYFTSFASPEMTSNVSNTQPTLHYRKGREQTNIYYSRMVQGQWLEPEPVLEINSDFHDRMPSVSPDGRYLFFSSNRPGGMGKDDIWVSEYDLRNRRWMPPVNAGSGINTASSEISPSIHADGITLYFSSNRGGFAGGYDIFVTQKLSTGWKVPANLGTPYNSPKDDEYPTVTGDGQYMYLSSNREGGFGGFDIYRASVPEFAKPEVIITLKGYVHEAENMKGVEANIRVESAEEVRNYAAASPSGSYSIPFRNKKLYRIIVTAPGFRPLEDLLDLREMHVSSEIRKNFPLLREAKLPPFISLRVRFIDPTETVLKPNVTYALQPLMPDFQILSPGSGDYSEINIKVRDSFPDASGLGDFVGRQSLHLNAQMAGYEPLITSLKLSDIIPMDGELRTEYILPDQIMMPAKKEVVTTETGKKKPVTDTDPKGKKTGETTTGDPEKGKKTAETGKLKITGRKSVIIYFGKNSDVLTAQARKQLKQAVTAAKDVVAIEISGHADRDGSYDYNLNLSQRRSEAVKTYLSELGLDRKDMTTRWYSYSKPAVAGGSRAAKQRNRRVEILILSGKAAEMKKQEMTGKTEMKNPDTGTEQNTETGKKEKEAETTGNQSGEKMKLMEGEN